MSRSRMFRGDEVTRENESPRTTIVGGRPPESAPSGKTLPVGMESLLRLAAIDVEFRRRLLDRRAEVATAAGVELTGSEAAILTSISSEHLKTMIERIPPPPQKRREFLQQAAASAVILLGGTGLVSCARTQGIRPDMPPPREDREILVTAGVVADPPPPPPDEDPPPEDPDPLQEQPDDTPMPNAGMRIDMPIEAGQKRDRDSRE